ncbi:MAG: molybdenum cofactor guanylyltransferase [Anaerovoracaceae bacterium]|jgi:molybdopterin-guanine dinucleotide biosynthesis protein A
MKHSAIILSGGKNTRMDHKNKAFLPMGEDTLLGATLKKFSIFDEVLIATNKPEEYRDVDARIVTDIIPHHGPLSGMHAGLHYASYDHCFIISCDMPFVPLPYIQYCLDLEKGYDVAVPFYKGFFEPTCAMYTKNTLPAIEKALRDHVRMPIKIYPELNVRLIQEDELRALGNMDKMFVNINTVKEYEGLLGSPPCL